MTRKEEIIYATLELASESGLKSVSMSQIAEKVGIKAPSIYNHFRSKDEIVQEMYRFLREQAMSNSGSEPVDYAAMFDGKTLEEILMSSLSAYMGVISDKYMLQFFKVLYSERSTNPVAAGIMVEETERMLSQSRALFYALAVHGKIRNQDADMASMTYCLTMHSLIDHQMDKITAGEAKGFGDGKRPIPGKIVEFVKWFSSQMTEPDRH